ncbi:MAG TPA: hypothetical protein DIT64_19905 [Verrucomicrobiales bacterium]|nr:hypothetical protein [Verrucomicrobiales bacterium]HCN76954.1 hypothetical protein [Verrucomicrobiales bacterium]HRJ10365.1 hypothetical protein [Prosthecobacter sp.]HRK15910.1 hypothetical protein [Prosthecobacter sp.]
MMLCQCASYERFYDRLQEGEFKGKYELVKTGGTDPMNRAEIHILRQKASAPFHFTRSGEDGEVIEPMRMKTSGGSIPYAVQVLVKRNENYLPYTFERSYFIHDWLFEAHKHKLSAHRRHTLQSAALVMAECQKTEVEEWRARQTFGTPEQAADHEKKLRDKRQAIWLQYQAVKSFIAKKMWDGAPEPRPGGPDYEPEQVTTVNTSVVQRVDVQIADERQRPLAENLRARMLALGLKSHGVENVVRTGSSEPPLRTEVRYHNEGDMELALYLQEILSNPRHFGEVRVVKAPPDAGAERRRQLEVWFPRIRA